MSIPYVAVLCCCASCSISLGGVAMPPEANHAHLCSRPRRSSRIWSPSARSTAWATGARCRSTARRRRSKSGTPPLPWPSGSRRASRAAPIVSTAQRITEKVNKHLLNQGKSLRHPPAQQVSIFVHCTDSTKHGPPWSVCTLEPSARLASSSNCKYYAAKYRKRRNALVIRKRGSGAVVKKLRMTIRSASATKHRTSQQTSLKMIRT